MSTENPDVPQSTDDIAALLASALGPDLASEPEAPAEAVSEAEEVASDAPSSQDAAPQDESAPESKPEMLLIPELDGFETRSMDDDEAWNELHADLNRALDERLTLAFLGSASTGKDSAIKALFGIDFGEIDPVPGSTDRVRAAAIDAYGKFLLVNAPGFQDIRQQVDRTARQVLNQVDVAIYLVNAEGGATAAVKADLEAVRRDGRPTLVCVNKIDLIRPRQREEFVQRTLAQLGVDPKDAVATSFDPHPRLGIDPIGLDQVVEWIDERLREDGKELLFAKHLRNRRLACAPIIKKAARRSAIAGAVPVPGADITAVTWIQVRMVEEIAAVHGKKLDRDVVLWIVGELLAASSKGLVRKGVSALKAAGFIPGGQVATAATAAVGGAVAAAATHGVGEAAIRYMENENPPSLEDLKMVVRRVTAAKVAQLRAPA